jgi:hypothetical protein
VPLSVWLQPPAVVVVLAENSAETPDPLTAAVKTVISWLQQHYGVWGIAAALGLLIWWQWPKLKELPGVAPLADWLKDRVIQRKRHVASITGHKPHGDRFSLAVARLINDNEDSESKTLVVEELKRAFPGIEIKTLRPATRAHRK